MNRMKQELFVKIKHIRNNLLIMNRSLNEEGEKILPMKINRGYLLLILQLIISWIN